jgi:hypothetical protein
LSDQSEDGATTTQESDQHRLAHDEEIRSAKKQQWTIATATVTLIAAIYAVAKNNDLTSREKIVFAVLVAIVGVLVALSSPLIKGIWEVHGSEPIQPTPVTATSADSPQEVFCWRRIRPARDIFPVILPKDRAHPCVTRYFGISPIGRDDRQTG